MTIFGKFGVENPALSPIFCIFIAFFGHKTPKSALFCKSLYFPLSKLSKFATFCDFFALFWEKEPGFDVEFVQNVSGTPLFLQLPPQRPPDPPPKILPINVLFS